MEQAIQDAKQAYLDELAVGGLIDAIGQMPAELSAARTNEAEAERAYRELLKEAEDMKNSIVFLCQAEIAEGKNADMRRDITNGILGDNKDYQNAMKHVRQAEVAWENARMELSAVNDKFSAKRNQARLVSGVLNYLA